MYTLCVYILFEHSILQTSGYEWLGSELNKVKKRVL